MQAGKVAKGPTALEFLRDVLGPAIKAARMRLQRLLKKAKDGVQLRPLFSFDSAKIHKSALGAQFAELRKEYKWSMGMRFALPVYSPDMHRVIEHAHARAVLQFRQWLYEHPAEVTIGRYKTEFEKIFRECCTPDIIAQDVAGLPELYQVVKARDGAWAPKQEVPLTVV
jgi:hypothetical protein